MLRVKAIKSLISFLLFTLSALSGLLLPAQSVLAALPPYFQTSKEIIAILNDPKVAEKIGSGRTIDDIKKTKNGYILQARECTLEVAIEYNKPKGGVVGPVDFNVTPMDFNCKEMNTKELEDKD